MALVKWTEDYGIYKKGDEFNLDGDGLEYLVKSGKLEIVSRENRVNDSTIYQEDASKETATAKTKTEKR